MYRLSKVAHFIPIRTLDFASDLALIHVGEIVRLHEIPRATTSCRDVKFVS